MSPNRVVTTSAGSWADAAHEEDEHARLRSDMKPRLLFLRYNYETDAPRFLVSHSDEHVRCLSQHFNVVIVSHDCDYAEVCDMFEPEVTLFEVGLQVRRAARLRLSNIHSNPSIPKIGLLNADPWGATRSLALSDFDYLNLEAIFCIGLTTAVHLHDVGRAMFYWPNFIDPDVFHDYRQEKIVPFALTGANNPSYPWRQAVFKRIAAAFPCIVVPHLGYSQDRSIFQMPTGATYAKLINTAWMAPSCGSVAGELVRKHLEIPACRTALVTEDTPAIRAAGFRDMENCIFADEENVVSKAADILSHPDDFMRLIDAGHALVHSRHTMRNRTQIFEWFQLRQRVRSNQRIVQKSAFSSLSLVPESDTELPVSIGSSARHLMEMSDGYAALRAGQTHDARNHFLRALGYFDTLAEAKLGLAICSLLDGRPFDGIYQTAHLIKDTLARHEDVDPDPAEWAQLIVCYLCLGKLRAAFQRATQYENLQHPDLDHVRQVLLGTEFPISSGVGSGAIGGRSSLHKPLADDIVGWQVYLSRVLVACGQSKLGDRILSGRLGFARLVARLDKVFIRGELLALGRLLGSHRVYLPGSGRLRGLDNPLLLQTMFGRIHQTLAWLMPSLPLRSRS